MSTLRDKRTLSYLILQRFPTRWRSNWLSIKQVEDKRCGVRVRTGQAMLSTGVSGVMKGGDQRGNVTGVGVGGRGGGWGFVLCDAAVWWTGSRMSLCCCRRFSCCLQAWTYVCCCCLFLKLDKAKPNSLSFSALKISNLIYSTTCWW